MAIPVIGVDPGKSGGFAFIDPDGVGDAIKFPRIIDDTDLDYAQLEALFGDLRLSGVRDAFVETLVKFAGTAQTGASAATYAYTAGGVRGILEAQHWNISFVPPVTWQRRFTPLTSKFFQDRQAWKNHLRDTAQGLFPYLKVNLATADALLVAQFGFTNLNP